MRVPLKHIPESPFLRHSRLFGFHLREHLQAYVKDDASVRQDLMDLWHLKADSLYADTFHLLRAVYGITERDVPDEMLAAELDLVLLDGDTWEDFSLVMQELLDRD